MDNNQNQQGQQLQIDLSPEIAKGIYTNFQIISHSSSEFVLDFISMLPGVPKPTVASRVVLAPEHAKRLLAALQENIVRYEQEFGKIQMPNQQPRTATPFGPVKLYIVLISQLSIFVGSCDIFLYNVFNLELTIGFGTVGNRWNLISNA